MMPPLANEFCISLTDKIGFRIPEFLGEVGNLFIRRTFNLKIIPGFGLIQRDREPILLENSAVLRVLVCHSETDFLKDSEEDSGIFNASFNLFAMLQF